MSTNKFKYSLLLIFLLVLVLGLGSPFIAYAKEPTPQSGTNTFKGTYGYYSTIGNSLMIGSYTTSISKEDTGYISSSETTRPVYPKEFQVTLKNGARYLQGSIKSRTVSGTTKYFNYNIVLHPSGFNPNSAVKGRSFLDNLSLESGVNKTSLGETLAKGNVTAWVNAIISVRTYESGPRHEHARFYAKRLWSNGKSNYNPYPDRVYSTSAVKKAMSSWSEVTLAAFDAQYNNKFILPAIIEADGTPPSGTFSPNSASWRNSNLSVTFSPSDRGGSGVKRWRYRTSSNNGSSYGNWSSYYTNARNITLSSQGRWKIQCEVEDNAGNKATLTSGTYNIDKTNPSGSFSPSSQSWTNSNVTVKFTPSDSGGSGVNQWRYRTSSNNGSSYGSWSSYYTSAKNISLSSQGQWKIQVQVSDKAGNSATLTSGTYRIDKTAPSGSLSASTTSWTNGNVTITASGSDSGGSGFYRIKKPDGTYTTDTSTTYTVSSNGTYSFVFYDNAGNSTTKSITISNIDKTKPSASFAPNSSIWVNRDINTVITPSDSGGSGVKRMRWRTSADNGSTYGSWSSWINGSAAYTLPITTEGYYKVQVEVEDNAGNTQIVTSGTFLLDKTAPTGSLSPNTTAWTNQNVTITATGSDALSGMYQIKKPDELYAKGSSTTYAVSSNGTYTFVFYDNAGNSTKKSITVSNIDKTAPTGSVTADTTELTNGNVVLTAIGSDSGGSGFYRIKKPDGTYTNDTRATYTVTENGNYTFVFYDNAGNATEKTYTVNNIDKTPPDGTLTPSTTAWTNQNVVITVKGNDIGVAGLSHIKLPDGTIVYDAETAYTVTTNGTYTFVFYDRAGNSTTKSIKIENIDKELPDGAFSPNNHAWTNKDVVVRFTPSDKGDSGVYRWRYRISSDNGSSYGSWSSYIDGDTPADIALTATGNFKIQAEVVDRAGNSTTKTSGTYYIDKINPTATFTPHSHNDWTNKNISVKINVSDSTSGVKRWRWRTSEDGGATYDAWRNYIEGNTETTVVLDVEGVRRLQVEVEDVAGNINVITSGIYNIDKTIPDITSQGITSDIYFDGTMYWVKQNGRVDIRIRSKDDLSLLESMILQLASQTDVYRQDYNFTSNLSSVVKSSDEIDYVSGSKTHESSDKTVREATFTVTPKVHGKEYGVSVWLRDYAGNILDYYNTGLRFKVDGEAPVLTVTKNITDWTKEDVVLTAVAVDPDSGVKKIILPDGTEEAKDKVQFTVTKNGNYTFIAEDNLGHRTTVVVSVTNIDKSKPTNAMIIINDDDEFTNSRDVVLTLYAEDNRGVTHMRFKMDNGSWSDWIPYATSYNYTMSSGLTVQGTNRVYAQFRDEVGNVSDVAYDSIVYDSIAPLGSIKYYKKVVNTRSINLTIEAYDINPEQADIISGLDSVRFRELQNGIVKQDWTSWEKHQPTRSWVLSEGDGEKVIEMEIRDNAGNINRVSRTFLLDTLFIDKAEFTDIVNPPLGNPELPTSEVVKVKKGYEFTFVVKTIGDPDEAAYHFNGESGTMDKLGDNLFRKTLKISADDEKATGLLPITITVKRHSDGAKKSTTLKVLVDGSAYNDFNINLTN